MNIDAGEAENQHLVKTIEVKNEDFTSIAQADVQLLKNKFMGLQLLNLSMNKIACNESRRSTVMVLPPNRAHL